MELQIPSQMKVTTESRAWKASSEARKQSSIVNSFGWPRNAQISANKLYQLIGHLAISRSRSTLVALRYIPS